MGKDGRSMKQKEGEGGPVRRRWGKRSGRGKGVRERKRQLSATDRDARRKRAIIWDCCVKADGCLRSGTTSEGRLASTSWRRPHAINVLYRLVAIIHKNAAPRRLDQHPLSGHSPAWTLSYNTPKHNPLIYVRSFHVHLHTFSARNPCLTNWSTSCLTRTCGRSLRNRARHLASKSVSAVDAAAFVVLCAFVCMCVFRLIQTVTQPQKIIRGRSSNRALVAQRTMTVMHDDRFQASCFPNASLCASRQPTQNTSTLPYTQPLSVSFKKSQIFNTLFFSVVIVAKSKKN